QSCGKVTAAPPLEPPSENEARKVGILRKIADICIDIGAVDHDLRSGAIRRVEGNVVEHALHHCLQPPCADILHAGVEVDGDAGQSVDRVVGEFELDSFRLHQGDVLLDQACLRFGEDPAEILLFQGSQFDTDRQATLQLRQEVRRLGNVESTGRNEQDVVSLYRSVFRSDGRAFDQRQKVALYAFA